MVYPKTKVWGEPYFFVHDEPFWDIPVCLNNGKGL